MQSLKNNKIPVVSHANVRRVLNQLVYSAQNVSEPELIHMALVDDWLEHTHGWVSITEARNLGLRYVLTEYIERQLKRIRQEWGRSSVDRTRTEAWDAIRADIQTGSRELIGWSWLYYHYVRVELEVTPVEYSQLTGINLRSLRRYQKHAIQRLTEELFEAEVRLRRTNHERQLRAELPMAVPPRLFGREKEIAWLLQPRLPPQHVQITGMTGIGKSALALNTIHHQITSESFDRVLWIKDAPSVQYILGQIYPPYERLALVLDEGSILEEDSNELTELLDILGSSTVYLISRNFKPLLVHTAHLALTGIDIDAVEALVEDMRQRHLSESVFMPDAETLKWLWEESGGNPANLLSLLHSLWYDTQPIGLV